MANYLISFPGPAMEVPREDMAAVGEAAHAVIRDAKEAGVYVFGGGIDDHVAPLSVDRRSHVAGCQHLAPLGDRPNPAAVCLPGATTTLMPSNERTNPLWPVQRR